MRTTASPCSPAPASPGCTAAAPGNRVTGVELADGRLLPADVVVIGIGVRPNTAWLADSGLPLDDGVLCDAGCATPLPAVVAVGDVARVNGTRAEHWTSATEQAAVAAQNLLAGSTVATHRNLPYFWSDQYGVRLQFAGTATAHGHPAHRRRLPRRPQLPRLLRTRPPHDRGARPQPSAPIHAPPP